MKENKESIKNAKQIFCKYNGSPYQMVRDEVYDTYKEYHIPKQMEMSWANELIEGYFRAIQNENNERVLISNLYKLSDIIVNTKNETGYASMMSFIRNNIETYDSFTKVLVAETIVETIRKMHYENFDFKMLDLAINIMKQVLENPIIISEYNLFNGETAMKIKEELMERAKEDILKWENHRNPRKRGFDKIMKYLKKH